MLGIAAGAAVGHSDSDGVALGGLAAEFLGQGGARGVWAVTTHSVVTESRVRTTPNCRRLDVDCHVSLPGARFTEQHSIRERARRDLQIETSDARLAMHCELASTTPNNAGQYGLLFVIYPVASAL